MAGGKSLATALVLLLALATSANAFFLQFPPSEYGPAPACDGSFGTDWTQLGTCVAQRINRPFIGFSVTVQAFQTAQDCTLTDCIALPDIDNLEVILFPINSGWTEVATSLRIPLPTLLGNEVVVNNIVAFNIGTGFENKAGNAADPITNNVNSGAKFTPVLDSSDDAQVIFEVDNYRWHERQFRVKSKLEFFCCELTTKVLFPNVFTSDIGDLGSFGWDPVTKTWDLDNPVAPDSPVVHVTNKPLVPNNCNVYPTLEDIACEGATPAYCELLGSGVNVPPAGGNTYLIPSQFAFFHARLALGLSVSEFFDDDQTWLRQRILDYNTIDKALYPCDKKAGDCEPTFLYFGNNDTNLDFGTLWSINYEYRSALQRLCGGALAGKYLVERLVFIGRINSATAISPAIPLCEQDVAYITDAVLLPPDLFSNRTVYDIVTFRANLPFSPYQIFNAWLNHFHDLVDLYKGVDGDSDQLCAGITVLLPTDRGIRHALLYLKIGENPFDLAGLIPDKESDVKEHFVRYHTVTGTYFTYNLLVDASILGSLVTFSDACGDDLCELGVQVLGEIPHQLIRIIGDCSSANIILPLSNARAVNGIVHSLDWALVPAQYCRSACTLIEINPLTNVFIALVYALGLEKDLCTDLGCDDIPLLKTFFVPTDLAFTGVFQYLQLSQNEIFEWPALLYDIILYHILYDVLLTFQMATGVVAVPVLGLYTAADDCFPQLEFIRRDGDDFYKGWHPTTIFVQGQEFNNPPAEIIIGDQLATDGVVHTIDRVLLPCADRTCITPDVIYIDGECDAIPCTIAENIPAALAATFSIETKVTYIPDPTCLPWCLAWWCHPCTPLHAQPIVTIGPQNFTYTGTFFDDPVGAALNILNKGNLLGALSLYVNQVGELRLGVTPFYNQALFKERHIFSITNAPSIYAACNIFPGRTYTILVTYSQDCGLLKIYVNDIITAVAIIDFGLGWADSAEPQEIIVGGANPLVNIQNENTVSAQFTAEGLAEPIPDGKIPVFFPHVGLLNGPVSYGLDGATSDIATLIDGLPGWSRIDTFTIPDYLAESKYFHGCDNPKYHQCNDDYDGKDACCGLSARFLEEWLGTIEYVYIYFGAILYPSACENPDFTPTPLDPVPIVPENPLFQDPFFEQVPANPLDGGVSPFP